MATVRGVVIATWAGRTAFGFTIEDPAGGADSAIAIRKGSSSLSTATAPAIGDDVTVTGTVVAKAHPISI